MKASPFLAISLFLTTVALVTPAAASEQVAVAMATAAEKAETAVDCSKETWPNFSPSCLRNANQTVEVRIVTATRR